MDWATCHELPHEYVLACAIQLYHQNIETRDVGASWRLVSWEATLGRKNPVGVTKYDQELQLHTYNQVDLTQ